MNRVVIMGGGVLGTMHALEALDRGWEVVHLEREAAPRGASVRNFGLIWVSGRAPGAELALALRAREKWERIGTDCPGSGFRANGSLTAVCDPGELAVLEQVVARADADVRGLRLVEADEAVRINPALTGALPGGPVSAALHCSKDAAVEPRSVLGAIRDHCLATGRYEWLANRTVVDIHDRELVDDFGTRHEGDLVVLCPGATHDGVVGRMLQDAPLRRVRLQMLETERYDTPVTTSVADADSLRYYPAFDVPARENLRPQEEIGAAWASQLLLVQRLDGALTIGDTHTCEEPFAFDVDEAPYRSLLDVAGGLLGSDLPEVRHRWAGVYSQVTEAAGDVLYLRVEPLPGVVVVTGPGGRGMTLSPAIAEETFA